MLGWKKLSWFVEFRDEKKVIKKEENICVGVKGELYSETFVYVAMEMDERRFLSWKLIMKKYVYIYRKK